MQLQELFDTLKQADNRHKWLVFLLAFFIPVSQGILPLFIIGLALNFFTLSDKRLSNWSKILAFLILFFLLHALGLIWSSNLGFGLFDVQIKLSFLILPFVFLFSKKLSEADFERTLSFYIWGCFAAIVYGILRVVISSIIGESDYINLYAESLSPSLHIGYFAMYMNLAVIILFHKLFFRSDDLFSRKNLLRIFLMLFFAVAVFLSTSRNGLIVLLFLLVVLTIYAVIRFKKWMTFLSLGVIMWIVMSSVFKDYSSAALQFHGFDEVVTTLKTEDLSKKHASSTSVRIQVWQSATNIIKRNPLLGVGTGDIKDELVAEYERNEFLVLIQRKFNAHNQFLQTAAALGIPAAILLLIMFLAPLFVGWKRIHFLGVFLSIIVGVACLTESVLEVQAGVVFYAFFASLFAQNMTQDYGTNFIDNPLIYRRKQKTE